MKKILLTKRLILYEIVGFGTIILILWIDEIFDLPYNLFGANPTPINWVECIFESVIIIISSSLIIYLTVRLLKQIKHLEGFLPVCSFCKRIRVDEKWIPIDQYIMEHSEAELSHGLCPECAKKHYGDLLKK